MDHSVHNYSDRDFLSRNVIALHFGNSYYINFFMGCIQSFENMYPLKGGAMEKLNKFLDKLALIIVTSVGITIGLMIAICLSYILISIMGLYNFLFACVVMWAFLRVMPNDDHCGCPY